MGSVEDSIPSHPPQVPASDLSLGGGEPLSRAPSVLPVAGPVIERLEAALNNLVLTATNNTTVLQQLTAANLTLMATVGTLNVTSKKLVDVASCPRGPPAGTPAGGARPTKKSLPRQLLLDARPPHLQGAHECSLHPPSHWPTR